MNSRDRDKMEYFIMCKRFCGVEEESERLEVAGVENGEADLG